MIDLHKVVTCYLLNKKSVLGLGTLIGMAVSVFGISLITFSFSRVFIVSITMMALA
jgi:hypothetical protein